MSSLNANKRFLPFRDIQIVIREFLSAELDTVTKYINIRMKCSTNRSNRVDANRTTTEPDSSTEYFCQLLIEFTPSLFVIVLLLTDSIIPLSLFSITETQTI